MHTHTHKHIPLSAMAALSSLSFASNIFSFSFASSIASSFSSSNASFCRSKALFQFINKRKKCNEGVG